MVADLLRTRGIVVKPGDNANKPRHMDDPIVLVMIVAISNPYPMLVVSPHAHRVYKHYNPIGAKEKYLIVLFK
jgi:hypothetical protein